MSKFIASQATHAEWTRRFQRSFLLDDDEGAPACCFYCDVAIPKARIEMDHFPIPERCGGIETVPACVVCHDLKDRVPLFQMPVEAIGDFCRDVAGKEILVWREMSRYGRLMLAKQMAVYYDMKQPKDAPPSPRRVARLRVAGRRSLRRELASLGSAIQAYALRGHLIAGACGV
jgi:hypothetical protein